MLGIGAPGVWYSFKAPTARSLRRSLLATAVALPLSVILIVKVGGFFQRGTGRVTGLGSLFPPGIILIVVVVLAAMLCMGTVVCIILLQARGRAIGKVYGADLLGATIGALIIIPLMHWLPTPHIIALCGFLPLIALLIRKESKLASALIAGTIILAMIWGEPFTLRYNKDYKESKILYEKWTPTARITVIPDIGFFGWGMGSNYRGKPAGQPWIEQDGAAGTVIIPLKGSPKDIDYLFFDVTSVGYQLRPPKKVCIIGAGGGRDIVTALKAGAQSIDAVELNEHIISALRGPFKKLSGGVYDLQGVNGIASEGRSYLTRSKGGYDLIQISLIDSYTATAAGAYALSENYLYTHEALTLYWKRLSKNGLVSISRWFEGRRQLEGVRMALMAKTMLVSQGIESPNDHIAVVLGGKIATTLISKNPLTELEYEQLATIISEKGFESHWPASAEVSKNSLIPIFLKKGVPENIGVDLSSPTDDHPFFFQTISFFDRVKSDVAAQNSTNEHSILLLRWLIVLVTFCALVLFFAPFFLAKQLKRAPGFWRGSLYFASIGLAFMLVEAGYIQRFILYLGHPSYAMTVVLAALLLGAGIGSIVSARISISKVQSLSLILPLSLIAISYLISIVSAATLGNAYAVRVLVSVAFLMPSGFLMGFAFPSGMIRFGDTNKAWFWAINGAMGVFASIVSLALAMVIGFNNTVIAGIAVYIAAAILIKGKSDLDDF